MEKIRKSEAFEGNFDDNINEVTSADSRDESNGQTKRKRGRPRKAETEANRKDDIRAFMVKDYDKINGFRNSGKVMHSPTRTVEHPKQAEVENDQKEQIGENQSVAKGMTVDTSLNRVIVIEVVESGQEVLAKINAKSDSYQSREVDKTGKSADREADKRENTANAIRELPSEKESADLVEKYEKLLKGTIESNRAMQKIIKDLQERVEKEITERERCIERLEQSTQGKINELKNEGERNVNELSKRIEHLSRDKEELRRKLSEMEKESQVRRADNLEQTSTYEQTNQMNSSIPNGNESNTIDEDRKEKPEALSQ